MGFDGDTYALNLTFYGLSFKGKKCVICIIFASPGYSKILQMPGRVMIFDDDTDLLEVCSIVLRSKKYNVAGFNKCSDIEHEVKSFAPNVILMDNWIPDVGGVKATQLLKNHPELKLIPVIFFSANDRVEDLAREAGADFYLQKPFEIEELETTVSRAIAIHRQTGISEIR
jgi:DNA-binding response OmpR family regulator